MRFVMRKLPPFVTRFPAAGVGALLVAVATAAGCMTPQPQVPGQIAAEGELRNTIAGGKLINEGGPVFLLPGNLRAPSFFTGELAALTVRAERLDGGPFTRVAAASVAADGSFTLKGPITSELFFASTEFTAKDSLHRMRTLVRAQGGEPIILDAASSLVSAKIAVAAQTRKLDDLSYVDTNEVTSQVRSVLSTSLDAIPLDQTNEQLSKQLSEAALKNPALATSLRKWESTLLPASPSPSPVASGTAKPSPTPVPTPSGAVEPVK
jgi:hypothetical protein